MGNNMKRRIIALAIGITLAMTLAACSKTENSQPSPSASPSESGKETGEVGEATESTESTVQPPGQSEEQASSEPRSLEVIATEDAEKFLGVLKKEDTEKLSGLMVHAENEYGPDTMKTVIEGFRLYFDKLADLKLNFDSNQQTEEYYVENFVISGLKSGKERSIPFQVKYSKKGGFAAVQSDNNREPLFDSPLIGLYPYMVRDAGKYVEALAQKDGDSVAIHLGMDESTDEAKSVVRQLLQAYEGKLDLGTTKVVPVDYDENRKQFLFDLRDGKKQSHGIAVDASTYHILDEWAQ
ncbi:hypothetical protein [Cohnella herbarum]|uniref:Lipoprotein n=1 Tax=Cohnella herbarum TaxID=2728023 RepID=A0A7Z2VMZ5_9BACL|nr:hypothetical protein [Cohnella herbarum]QJD86068.1 hypothetical protein HH215_24750 [Cohnella herbarum]